MIETKLNREPGARAQDARNLTMNAPLLFTPFLRSMVWGGRRLEKDLGKLLPTAQPYGESWEISDHPINRSMVACGAQAGKSLRQLMEEDRAALLGPAGRTHSPLPSLVKVCA